MLIHAHNDTFSLNNLIIKEKLIALLDYPFLSDLVRYGFSVFL